MVPVLIAGIMIQMPKDTILLQTIFLMPEMTMSMIMFQTLKK
jgi:hypothetical protein